MRQDVPQKAGRLWGYNCVMRPESSVRSMPATSVPSWRADLNKSLGLRKPCPQRIRQKSGGVGGRKDITGSDISGRATEQGSH